MNIEEDSYAGIVVLRLAIARIDAATAPQVRAAIAKLQGRNLTRLILDLSAVDFVDSTGLGALVSALKLTGRSGSVAVTAAKDPVTTLFRVTRMDGVFRLFPNEAAAAAGLT